jgi:hypothetical protein
MTQNVGEVDHTLYDANNMIFMRSLYSMSEERQTIGNSIYFLFVDFRENVSRRSNTFRERLNYK